MATFNNLPLQQIAYEFGTPLYLYDADIILRQLNTFRKAFEGIDLQIFYAAKALTNINILRFMQQQGTGMDTVSLSEIQMGLQAGFSPQQIIFTPNCVAFKEIEEAVKLGVIINIENLPNLEKFGEKYGSKVPCCIRLHPHISTQNESQKVDNWHKQSKFGIARSQIESVHQLREKYQLRINGIHIHSSSKIMSPEVFLAGAKIVFDLAKDFPDLTFLDFGGGIKVNYKEGESAIDIATLGRAFVPAFQKFCREYGRELKVCFEPGRFLVSECGILLTEANVIKNNGSINIVGVNSGFNHLIRPMMYGAYHRILNLSNPNGPLQTYNVVGNICEIDNFAVQRELPQVREGDLLAILNAGAYGYSMASTYNSRFRPAEVLVVEGKARLIRRRDTLEDLMANQVMVDFP